MATPDCTKKIKREVITELTTTMADGYNRSASAIRRQDDAVRIVAAGIRVTSPRSVASVRTKTYTRDNDS